MKYVHAEDLQAAAEKFPEVVETCSVCDGDRFIGGEECVGCEGDGIFTRPMEPREEHHYLMHLLTTKYVMR